MKRKLLIALFALGLSLVLGQLLFPELRGRQDRQAPSSRPTPETPPKAASSAPQPSLTAPSVLARIVPPRRGEVIRDARENPHVTPESLRAFARSVAARLDHLRGDAALARQLFLELSDCALAPLEETVPSAQAYCLSGAQGISQAFPELKTDYDTLLQRAAPDVLRLMNAGELL